MVARHPASPSCGTAPAPLGQRAVRPIAGRGHQPGAQRVALDIAADRQQMGVVLEQERLAAALVEMALAARGAPGCAAGWAGARSGRDRRRRAARGPGASGWASGTRRARGIGGR